MSKVQKIISIILATLAVATATLTIILLIIQSRPEPAPVEPEPVAICPLSNGVVTYPGEDNKSALEILQSLCDVQLQPSATHQVVTSIAGHPAEPPTYWTFYVNGTTPLTDAATYQTLPTDTITWQLESAS